MLLLRSCVKQERADARADRPREDHSVVRMRGRERGPFGSVARAAAKEVPTADASRLRWASPAIRHDTRLHSSAKSDAWRGDGGVACCPAPCGWEDVCASGADQSARVRSSM